MIEKSRMKKKKREVARQLKNGTCALDDPSKKKACRSETPLSEEMRYGNNHVQWAVARHASLHPQLAGIGGSPRGLLLCVLPQPVLLLLRFSLKSKILREFGAV